ncbi:type VII secretion protein EccCa [Mycobacterium deserti]|uniref:Type VII secretion protein EccCa n=1 Tax=Mycobacterium deserti TaxID=2978347 RepID=A0ABT2M771_9MYCO|nr:type VII secretion protein EccCa [Mycobacterium deserti]MCT7658116.1 type VII secretion protein EccCa [Mycobacterium deserti]
MEFVRESRLSVPPLARGEIAVEAPPALPKSPPVNPIARLLPVAMLVAAVGMMAFYFTSGAGSARSPMFMFFPVMMLVSVLGTVAYSARGGNRTAEVNQGRQTYLRYLDTVDSAIVETTAQERRSLQWSHPDPDTLWELIGTRRMWERVPVDDDFGSVRLGLGDRRLSTVLKAPELSSADELDPVTVGAMRRWVRQRSLVAGAPVAVALTPNASVTIEGDSESVRGLLRAMVCQLAVLHGPDDIAIAAAADESARGEWDWLKWLPHHQHPRLVDAVGSSRLVSGNLATSVDESMRHVVVIVDGIDSDLPHEGVTLLRVGNPASGTTPLRLRIADRDVAVARPDSLTRAQAVTCARRLAPYRPASATTGAARLSPAANGWLQSMGFDDPGDIDPARLWRTHDRVLPVPIGVDEHGTPVMLDINEASRDGMGPHGLCVGATGSGKSEFLRTLALGMIAVHPPDALNLILVDFKGGATFAGLERTRHVAAVITNLADEAHLVARMSDALAGEINRRQELLRAAGSANLADYARARAQGAPLTSLPALFIVVDEFSELLSQHPEFAELFVAIGRLGRSLGVHLLLASQRLDEGRLRGLETHLSYRICLKTFSASESRAVLGTTDAHHLPGTPGAAYLKTASGDLVRFQTAYVSAPYLGRTGDPPATARQTSMPLLFTAAPVGAIIDRVKPTDLTEASVRTLFDAVVDRVADRGSFAHRVWLPPLTTSPTLDALMSGRRRAGLTVPIGLVDNPYQQRRDVMTAELCGPAGNVAIIGAPRSGKSTAVRTLIQALAEAHSPAEVGFYCLDFGGGSLSSLRDLPHVGAVAGRHDVDLCRRTVAVVESVMRGREGRAAAGVARSGESYGDVFLVVDGWATLRGEYDALEGPITAIAAQGLSFGVHVVVTASRWAELRPALKDQIATRIELRLGDPAESEMDRKRARQLAQCPPGRGLTADGRQLAIAVAEAPAAHAARLRGRWGDQRTPPVELLPQRVAHSHVIERSDVPRSGTQLLLGLGERELTPTVVDFGDHPHLLVLGEGSCGKTSLLRLLCREIIQGNDADAARVEIVDFRRTLLGVVESEHLSGYTVSPAALVTRIGSLIDRLQSRMPDENVTQQQLRSRSWWSGPEIYLVIDDYDLVAAATGSPLTPLSDFLPYARDLGLHVIVARRSGGAARAMFDPVLTRLRELGCMGLMMSASPDEGVLLGSVRPSALPPGRGTLIVRGEADQLIQVAWSDPP